MDWLNYLISSAEGLQACLCITRGKIEWALPYAPAYCETIPRHAFRRAYQPISSIVLWTYSKQLLHFLSTKCPNGIPKPV